jgi:hypothetical protein
MPSLALLIHAFFSSLHPPSPSRDYSTHLVCLCACMVCELLCGAGASQMGGTPSIVVSEVQELDTEANMFV